MRPTDGEMTAMEKSTVPHSSLEEGRSPAGSHGEAPGQSGGREAGAGMHSSLCSGLHGKERVWQAERV